MNTLSLLLFSVNPKLMEWKTLILLSDALHIFHTFLKLSSLVHEGRMIYTTLLALSLVLMKATQVTHIDISSLNLNWILKNPIAIPSLQVSMWLLPFPFHSSWTYACTSEQDFALSSSWRESHSQQCSGANPRPLLKCYSWQYQGSLCSVRDQTLVY